ncbi:TIR-like protein FxsC [Actinoplanes rectilineatus]|uniref:TIR-like protein FxsC n=1 Tax=Actinoplanes rectilineatus TaxID=113571 RepID=UPI0024801D42|nr:TIR-like protein FxsC [Actinoplanes rectilineatus]
MRLLYFFLSYAHGDDDHYVMRFFKDLSAEVRVLAGADPHEEVGFLDAHSIELGELWRSRLTTALSESRCFVALCTPRYVMSPMCTAEWAAFEDKMHRYQQSTGVLPGALMPLSWCALEDIPDITERYQRTHQILGPEYSAEGVRQLVRLSINRDQYRRMVSALAGRIVRLARSHDLPPLPADRTLESYSPPGTTTTAGTKNSWSAPDTAEGSVGLVHFVVAAAARTDMLGQRESLEYYGESALDWAPYRPHAQQALALLAGDIAQRRSFRWQVAGLSELHALIMRANLRNEVIVLLVDAWAARFDEHRDVLLDYDRRNEPTTAIIIPIAVVDQETTDSYPILHEAIRRALPNNSVRRDAAVYHERIEDPTAFDNALSRALRVAQNRIFDRGRRDDGGGHRPILPAPM